MEENKIKLMVGLSAAFVSYILTFFLQRIQTIYDASFILQLFVMFFIVVVSGYGIYYLFEVFN